EACVGAHHLSRKLQSQGHDARLMPAKYVRAYLKGQDAEAIAEAVQRPTMRFVATKTVEQLDLQALHRVRERLVGQRTGIINQIRASRWERGVAVRRGSRFSTFPYAPIRDVKSGSPRPPQCAKSGCERMQQLVCRRQNLLDHFVGALLEKPRHVEAERL